MRGDSVMDKMIGKRFGRLVVIKLDHRNKRGDKYYLCRCDCGNEKVIYMSSLNCGNTLSCGCLNREITSKSNSTHGYTKGGLKPKTYNIWRHMNSRCGNTKAKHYASYGGRGIKVCARWQGKEGFSNFVIDMGECPAGMSIERIDNNAGYSPDNCKWATPKEQANNKRTTLWIEYKGVIKNLTQWADFLGIGFATLWVRLYQLGWSIDKAFNVPVDKSSCCRPDNVWIEYKGEIKTVTQWAKFLNINVGTLRSRLYESKWSIERAFTTPVKSTNKKKI